MLASIHPIDWIVLIAYASVLMAISIYHSRKLKTQDDVLLAGRSMSRWPIALSMYMALFSTNTFVGVTGWLNRPDGTVWIGLQNIGIMLAVPFVIWLYPSLFFRLRISTAYEYLEKRFNYPVRLFAAVFFLASRIMWMAIMIYSSGLVISMMLGLTHKGGHADAQTIAMILIGILGMLFAAIGGMHAVIWTDVMQFFVMMAGVITMGIFAISYSGGIQAVLHEAIAAHKFAPPPLFSAHEKVSVLSGLLLGFIAMLSSAGADQVVLQTYLTARSEQEAKRSLWRNGLLLKPLSLLFPLLGLLMFVYYQKHPEIRGLMRKPDDALPVFVLNVLPIGMRGLMVVAILCAVLTSLASGMAATSACVQVDFVRRLRQEPLSPRGSVRLARLLIVVWGIAITLVSLEVQRLGEKNEVIDILNMIMYPFAGVLLGVFLLGILTTRANATGALIGAIGGFIVTVWAQNMHMSDFFSGALGTVATWLIGFMTSVFAPPPRRNQIQGLTQRFPPAPLGDATS